MEGCESFVDDLIGCRVLYSVRDALLHRSLEIQPWHFPDSLLFKSEALHGVSFFFFFFEIIQVLGRGTRDMAKF